MDYILKKLRRQQDIHKSLDEKFQYVTFLRVELEYVCAFLLGYLWNKNFKHISAETRQWILKTIARPSIGDIITICKTLDSSREFFTAKKGQTVLADYPSLRNHYFGHGFVFTDRIDDVASTLADLSGKLFDQPLVSATYDIILVTAVRDQLAMGIKWDIDGDTAWQCSTAVSNFEADNVYAKPKTRTNTYHRLSPFIHLRRDGFYLFSKMTNTLNGHTTYNQLFATGEEQHYWPGEFTQPLLETDNIILSKNGTIRNRFTKNFTDYIDFGAKKKIRKFLIDDDSAVCGVVWGHGGVGKTATVQSLCEDFCDFDDRRYFDYIIFASAKEKTFNYRTGNTESTTSSERIDSYESLLRLIHRTRYQELGDSDEQSPNDRPGAFSRHEVTNHETEETVKVADLQRLYEAVRDSEGRFLILIDDYETFPEPERKRIEDFIRTLAVAKRKVLITTRARVTAWPEFPTDELTEAETITFLQRVVASDFSHYPFPKAEFDSKPEIRTAVYNMTSGRPLFILYFAYLLVQEGLKRVLELDIKNETAAREFLFGSIYSYLSDDARRIFYAISQLVKPTDLTNLVSKLRFIVNMEDETDRFDRGLGELAKIKLVTVSDDEDIFHVYSADVLEMVSRQHPTRARWQDPINERFQRVQSDRRDLGLDEALLQRADRARYQQRREGVEHSYGEVLNRRKLSPEILTQAIQNLAEYLAVYCRDVDAALRLFERHRNDAQKSLTLVTTYAETLWRAEKERDAINQLQEFLKPMRGQAMFGVRGLYLMYSSLNLTKRYEETGYGHGAVRNSQEDQEIIKRNMRRLYREVGLPLFARLKQALSGGEVTELLQRADKHNVTVGLTHFTSVCEILEEIDTAVGICDFVLESLEQRATPQNKWFTDKRNSLLAKRKHTYATPGRQGPAVESHKLHEGTYTDFLDSCIVSQEPLGGFLRHGGGSEQLEEQVAKHTQSIFRLIACWTQNPERLRAFGEIQKKVVLEYIKGVRTACEKTSQLEKIKRIDEFNAHFLSVGT